MDQFSHGSAVDAVVRASRRVGSGKGDASVDSKRGFSDGKAHYVDPNFAALLSRVLAGVTDMVVPCIQFVSCGAHDNTSAIAFRTAQAASSILGRTLLVNARTEGKFRIAGNATYAPVPDAFIPALYHYEIASWPGATGLLFGGVRKAAFHALVSQYKFVAIDCSAPSTDPAVNALAALCLGSILVVIAGLTTREAVRDASLNVTCAGGKIIGTILAEAPADLPAWISRL